MEKKTSKKKLGYFILARQIFESEVMDWNPVWFKLWIWLIGKANHNDVKEGGHVYHRGEVLTSYDELRHVSGYYVGFRLQKPSKTVIRNFIEALMKLHMATTTKTTRGFLIKIDKYDYFQSPKNYEDNNEDNNETTMRQQEAHTINKNDKNEKNENIKEINKEKILEIANKYGVSEKAVNETYEDLVLWCDSKGTRYKNYYAALCNWLRRNIASGKVKRLPLDTSKPLEVITEAQREKNLERLNEIRNQLKNKLHL